MDAALSPVEFGANAPGSNQKECVAKDTPSNYEKLLEAVRGVAEASALSIRDFLAAYIGLHSICGAWV